jgi:4-hydroxythreonine-4-phosphate dehydrogenase
MKIFVTQGHERGIGLEVFLKSALLLAQPELERVELLVNPGVLAENLKLLRVPHRLEETGLMLAGLRIRCRWVEAARDSLSFEALRQGMDLAEKGGVLFTLPTSKDQFPGFAGHTEYFRHHYKTPELGMFFSSPRLMVLLLSDHTPVARLSAELTQEVIERRLGTALTALRDWHIPIERVLVAGLNPHAGEGGLIGGEDGRWRQAVERLTRRGPFQVTGPFPGDTMLLEQKSVHDLLVYAFHDQGLGVFKGQQGFIGSNVTLGLPYLRFSPDHGTSFALYGKNAADYRGCHYALREALTMLKRKSDGQDPGHQGQGS